MKWYIVGKSNHINTYFNNMLYVAFEDALRNQSNKRIAPYNDVCMVCIMHIDTYGIIGNMSKCIVVANRYTYRKCIGNRTICLTLGHMHHVTLYTTEIYYYRHIQYIHTQMLVFTLLHYTIYKI